ncbi:uncharacterized protein C17orf107 homolog [Phascolarctos cinereus]|uniref:Uncharacterized protein C17orf107 homolog n=1 Tax=Phascolarctos cinereus TaxID=38626 RepID=A0A6P5IUJ7_PHACI|nr:uncharacterized protein C17orf107 homolog [Phascolarctos cinereus]
MKGSSGSFDALLWVYCYHNSTEVDLRPSLLCSLELALAAAHEYLEFGLEKMRPLGPWDQDREEGELPKGEGVKLESHSSSASPEPSLGLVLREAMGSALSFGTTLLQISVLWLQLETRRLCGCSDHVHNLSSGNPGHALSRVAWAAGRGVREAGATAKASTQLLLRGARFCLPVGLIFTGIHAAPGRQLRSYGPGALGWAAENVNTAEDSR